MRHSSEVIGTQAASLEDAHEIVDRLTQAGFARNSIEVARTDDGAFHVSLHVRAANVERAERAIATRWGALPSFDKPPTKTVVLGLCAVVVALGAYAAWTRTRDRL